LKVIFEETPSAADCTAGPEPSAEPLTSCNPISPSPPLNTSNSRPSPLTKEVVLLLVPSPLLSLSITIRNFCSKALFLTNTTNPLTKIAEPIMISKKSRTCWKVLRVLRLIVPSPESVMALTTMKRASMKRTL